MTTMQIINEAIDRMRADIEARLAEEANDVLRLPQNEIHPDQLTLFESADELDSAA